MTANADTITVAAGATYSAAGTLDNTGVIDFQGGSVGADLAVGSAGLTLTGAGQIVLGDSLSAPYQPCPPDYSHDYVTGGTLTNVDDTISGAGWIGLQNQGTALTLVNEAAGVIDASLQTDLMLDTTGTLINEGLLEATGAGGLYIIYSTVDSAGGAISANGGMVYLSYSDVMGGTLSSSGAGYVFFDWGGSTLDGSTEGPVTNKAFVYVSVGATLTLEGVIDNLGEITAGNGDASNIFVGEEGATLTGGGQIVLAGTDSATRLTGASATATLTNVDDTISGEGQLGAGQLTLVNQAGGVIDASQLTLTLDTGAAPVANAGLIEATNSAQLIVDGMVDNGSGTIEALGAANVMLQGATIEGGAIDLDDFSGETALIVGAAGATLSGGGQVAVTAGNIIEGASASATLDNDDTISGSGDIGGGQMSLVNAAGGVIDADGASALTVDTGAQTVINAGLIEAAGPGSLVLESPVANGGTLEAAGGVLVAQAAVTGAGAAVIATGTLEFAAGSNQNVDFTGPSGVLVLLDPQAFTGAVTGLGVGRGLDLRDVGFSSASEATFSAGAGGGVLTVVAPTSSASIDLAGDYLGASFVAASDGDGGVVVTDPNDLWADPVSGAFADASNWTGGAAPGASASAILPAEGEVQDDKSATPYAVATSSSQTVSEIQTAANATLEIGAGVFTATGGTGAGANAGTIAVAAGATLSASGALDNTGVIDLQGTGGRADLLVGSAGLTLAGAGQVVLGDSLSAPSEPCPPSYSLDLVTGGTLANVDDTISGAGWIGLQSEGIGLTVVNEAAGVIDASLPTDLIVDTTGTLINDGLLEATGAGGLSIVYSTVEGGADGVIAANGGMVYLSYAEIIGGTLSSSGDGYIVLDLGDTVIDGSTDGPVTNKAYVSVSVGATMTLEGALDNTGRIVVGAGAAPSSSSLFVGAGGATLTGGGQIILGGSNTQITGASSAATLTNVDDTISGQGQVGAGQLTLVNQAGGVIDASALTLTLDTGAASVVNAGLIEATGQGHLIIEGTVDDASGGRIEALGAASVTLQGATVDGGAIALDDSPGDAALIVGTSGAILAGGGQVTLATGTVIEGASVSATLDNADTISGSGQIGAGRMTLVNAAGGVIDADAPGSLVVDTSGASIVNDGLLEATGAGLLIVENTVVNDGGGGEILAAGRRVELDGVDMLGGTLATSGTGAILLAVAGATLDGAGGHQVTLSGWLLLEGQSALTLEGAIADKGEIQMLGGADVTELVIGAGGATLSGGGSLVMSDSDQNRILAAEAGAITFDNDDRIYGAGSISDTNLTLVNGASGLVDADDADPLVISTGANTIHNAGRIEASGTGGAVIRSALDNTGLLLAQGGDLAVDGAVTGAGTVRIDGGDADFASNITQDVVFAGATGTLELARSQGYSGTVAGFSRTGGDTLDLGDIRFVSAGEARFSGTAAGGVLTVTDGAHTARIRLAGDYLASTFVASSDGHGGTMVTTSQAANAASLHQFIAAAATLGAGAAGSASPTPDTPAAPAPTLAQPVG